MKKYECGEYKPFASTTSMSHSQSPTCSQQLLHVSEPSPTSMAPVHSQSPLFTVPVRSRSPLSTDPVHSQSPSTASVRSRSPSPTSTVHRSSTLSSLSQSQHSHSQKRSKKTSVSNGPYTIYMHTPTCTLYKLQVNYYTGICM